MVDMGIASYGVNELISMCKESGGAYEHDRSIYDERSPASYL
jgi:hypothetical protein